MRIVVWLVFGSFLLLAPAPLAAKETIKLEPLAELITPIQEKHKLPAMGVAIVRARGVTALGVSGVRRFGGKTPVTPNDKWHLGSCTKAMTATMVARLVQNGTLQFEDTIERRLAKVVDDLHADFKPVTLDLLLSNRGGTPAKVEPVLDHLLWQRQGTPREQRQQLCRGVLSEAPSQKPGTYVYSNAGFAVAGHIAEHATNTPWEDLMRKYLFVPLKMSSAGYDLPGTQGKDDQPLGHRPASDGWTPVEVGPRVDNPPSIGPAGTVHATLQDWGKFIALHLRGARGDESKFLTPKTFKRLHVPAKGQGYAMGWGVGTRPWAGGVLSHSGSNNMWYCVTWIAPAKGFAVIVTCNAAGETVAKACDEAAWAAIQQALKGAGK